MGLPAQRRKVLMRDRKAMTETARAAAEARQEIGIVESSDDSAVGVNQSEEPGPAG